MGTQEPDLLPAPRAHRGRQELLEELEAIQEELAKLHRELERSHRLALLGTLAAGIAHEFNNILTPALNGLELVLRQKAGSIRSQAALHQSHDAILRATHIASAILRLGAGRSTSQVFHKEHDAHESSCSPREAIEQAILCMGREPRRRKVSFEIHADGEASAAIDQVALQQVLVNLFLNAMNAMPSGGQIRVITQVGGPDARRSVVIVVEDQGVGIASDQITRIFDSFVSLDSQGGQQGHGLGLMVCRHLVEGVGGSIDVESALGEGTRFRIELPTPHSCPMRQSA